MQDNFLEKALVTATGIAREAGEILLSRFGGHLTVEHKGEVDLVTDADRASEKFLVGSFSAAFPEHSIVAEEGGSHRGSSPYAWIIDPLDGTTNFAHGFPFWCVSIALAKDDQPLLGVVYDPVRGECFTASAGGGAFLNGKRLSVSRTAALGESLLVTGFPYDIRRIRENNLDHFAAFALRAQAIRRVGSAALDLCYTGAGRFDGYWELNLKPWDMAAGVLVVREAGGAVSDFAGAPYSVKTTRIIASNGLIHEAMRAILAKSQ